VYAPSTLGSFLRAFTHGHTRKLTAAARQFLINLAGLTRVLADVDRMAYVDPAWYPPGPLCERILLRPQVRFRELGGVPRHSRRTAAQGRGLTARQVARPMGSFASRTLCVHVGLDLHRLPQRACPNWPE
jgi:hypothetical protein